MLISMTHIGAFYLLGIMLNLARTLGERTGYAFTPPVDVYGSDGQLTAPPEKEAIFRI